MRTTIVTAFALALSACSYLEQFQFGGDGRDPNKIYLDPMSVVSVSSRETYRYACFVGPLVCEQRGIAFDCHCE